MGVQNFYLAHGFKPWAIHPSINVIPLFKLFFQTPQVGYAFG
jgi:hypothetical protein